MDLPDTVSYLVLCLQRDGVLFRLLWFPDPSLMAQAGLAEVVLVL